MATSIHEDRELAALRLIAASEEPVGNFRLVRELEARGMGVGEATAGRLLRDLAERGYAETRGRRGRVLTPRGAERLAELAGRQEIHAQAEQLVEAVQALDADAALDLMTVRRAVEPEAARQAALRATDDEIEAMREMVCAHCRALQEEADRVDASVSFHLAVIRASRNEVLAAVGALLLSGRNLQALRMLDRIALDPRAKLVDDDLATREAALRADDHERILDAIAARDPERAAQEMAEHMGRLVAHVERTLARAARAGP